jgi:hypothetical protein
MSNKEINVTCHADYAVAIADNKENLRRLLYQFVISCQKYNMKISTKKKNKSHDSV